jgi:hypothetical protein
MHRAKGLLAIMSMFLLLGISNLLRYSEKVRFHDFVGIAAGGAMIGVALVGIVCCLVRSGKPQPADKKPAEEQAPVPKTGNK